MVETKYKLLLIRPKQKYKHYSTQFEMAKLMGKKTANSALALPLLAALTPKHYDIKILDEEIINSAEGYDADVVGITMITSNSERAYKIADNYRNRGIKVIIGGPYASYSPDEVLQHADSVVIGEAENLWGKILEDFENGQLQPKYQDKEKILFDKSVVPRWDLIDTGQILSVNIQASRGCPFQCEFCLTSQLFGRKVRRREIDDIINEIKQLPLKNVFFVDDNLTLHKPYALELFKALKPLQISWMCQSSVDVGDDPEFLKEMSESGCKFVLIGFESLNPKSLEETHKHQNNKEKYLEIIENIHKAGIHVYSSFILGFDNDTREDFEIFKSFIDEASLPVFMLSLLGSTKGTELHTRLENEGRIYQNLSKNFNVGAYPVFKYANFKNKELFDLFNETIKELYQFKNIRKRTIRLLEKGYFAKNKPAGSISFWQKVRTTFLLLRLYRFSKDNEKRMFFKDIIRLIREKKLAVNEAASMLLMIEGIVRHVNKSDTYKQEFYEELERNGID